MPDPQPAVTLLPAPANLARAARAPPKTPVRKAAAKPAKTAKKAKPAAPKLTALAQTLESGWEAALTAHQARIRRDFAALRKAVARARPADAAKLRRLLDRKPKASGRLKDVRRAERALKDALERLKA